MQQDILDLILQCELSGSQGWVQQNKSCSKSEYLLKPFVLICVLMQGYLPLTALVAFCLQMICFFSVDF